MTNDSTDRILSELQQWIGTAPPGARVPSNRALMAKHGASPVTVQKAMRRLVGLGLVESRPGVGTFVCAVHTARPVDYGWQTSALGAPQSRFAALTSSQRTIAPDAIGMHSGYPATELLPERLVRTALARAARTNVSMLRSPAAGLPELQAWFAAELAAASPPGITPLGAREALIISGSQSGLSSIFRALAGHGQPVLIESPTYWGAILAAQQAGVTLIPVTTGPHGPDPDDVDRAFTKTGARTFYAQPMAANPTGAQWDADTRRAMLTTVRRHGAFLIEDDWAHDLTIDVEPSPLAALDDDGHVIYLRSLTKSVSPSLRVATVIARGPARERILSDRAAESMYVSGLLQSAALDVVTHPGWRSHVNRLRGQLRERRDLLLTGLREHAPSVSVEVVPVGGLNLWAQLPDEADAETVVRECQVRGLIITPGPECFPAEPSGQFVRLNYSGADPARFPEAAGILGEVVDAVGSAG